MRSGKTLLAGDSCFNQNATAGVQSLHAPHVLRWYLAALIKTTNIPGTREKQ
jgi:hypothetical protein